MESKSNTKVAKRRPPRFQLTGDSLCLDFVNTLDDRPSGKPTELLKHYVDLARFAEDTGILSEAQVDRLIERSPHMPEQAQRALQDAIELREALYVVLVAILKKQPVPALPLAKVNGFVQYAAQHSWLVESNERRGGAGTGHASMQWRFDDSGSSLESPLWAITRSAADLLSSDDLAHVRACSLKNCQWLFLDTTKNHRRRWCDMKICGNRAKNQRFYRRKKTTAE